MKVTSALIKRPWHIEGSWLRCIASINIDKILAIRDIRLHEKPDGTYYLEYPQGKTDKNGIARYYNFIQPLSRELYDEILNAIVTVYKNDEWDKVQEL